MRTSALGIPVGSREGSITGPGAVTSTGPTFVTSGSLCQRTDSNIVITASLSAGRLAPSISRPRKPPKDRLVSIHTHE